MSKVENFLKKCFEKLSVEDFKSDPLLIAFMQSYNAYLDLTSKERVEEIKKHPEKRAEILNLPFTSLFDFYFEYLLKNVSSSPEQRQKDIKSIQNSIVITVLSPIQETVEGDIDNLDNLKRASRDTNQESKTIALTKELINAIENNAHKEQQPTELQTDRTAEALELLSCKVYKFDKSFLMKVLSECIANTLTNADTEAPDIVEPIDQDALKRLEIGIMTKLIMEDGIVIPEAKHDPDFNRKNAIIDLWIDCEKRLNELRINTNTDTLTNAYFLDTNRLQQPSANIYQIATCELEDIKSTTLISKPAYQSERSFVQVLNTGQLDAYLKFIQTNKQVIYVASEMQFNLGGNTEQGFETPITQLYLSSTLHLAINKFAAAYPLEYNMLFYVPFAIYIRDHLNGYVKLVDKKCEPIKIIVSAPTFRPRVNVPNIETSTYDERLLMTTTEYKKPEVALQRIIGIFKTAIFFGHKNIIFDDFGVVINRAPIHHTAKILGIAINKYKAHFDNIIVAVKNPEIYKIFKKYITN